MRVAVFSDVQANLQAMEVVVDDILHWNPDLVVMAGDLVNRGPRNRECLLRYDALRRQQAWQPVQGNHEEWVLHCLQGPEGDPIEAQLRRFTDWAAAQIGPEHAPLLSGWADHLCFADPGGNWVHVTHGSMGGNRAGISGHTSDEVLAGWLPQDIRLFVGGHTHKVHRRRFRGIDVINVGSVGSPFDRDPRAAYGRLEYRHGQWAIDFVRLPYDRAATERDFRDSGFLDEGGALSRIIYEEWRRAEGLISGWGRRYQAAVRAGQIDLQASVDAFLRGLD